MNQEKIGLFIKRKRIEKGLTQDQLANLLYVNSKTVSRWERGVNIPDISILENLAIELGVSVHELMLGQENKEADPNISIQYSKKEEILRIKIYKRGILLTLCFTLLILIDVSFGYFSTSLSWQINDRLFFPYGILFSLLFDDAMNYEGILLTQMFYIFIIVLIINIVLILIYVCLTLKENKIEISFKGSNYEK